MSRDLHDLLRAYGRQIEQDLKALPERSGDPAGSPSEQPAERRTRRAGRSSWMLIAATIALIALVTSLLFPSALLEGSPMNRKATGWVLGLCLMAGCTSTVDDSTPTIGSATPTSAPSTAPSPDVFDGVGMVEPGRYRVNRFGTPIELTVPKFWYRFASFALSGDGDSFVAFFDIAQVPTDACKWEQSKTAIGPTVQDLVTALTTQQNTVATTPEPRDLDGHPGVYLEVPARRSRPAELRPAVCGRLVRPRRQRGTDRRVRRFQRHLGGRPRRRAAGRHHLGLVSALVRHATRCSAEHHRLTRDPLRATDEVAGRRTLVISPAQPRRLGRRRAARQQSGQGRRRRARPR